jgi:hypothetical protein
MAKENKQEPEVEEEISPEALASLSQVIELLKYLVEEALDPALSREEVIEKVQEMQEELENVEIEAEEEG